MESRSSSAFFKRDEQLRRWQESETNRESAVPREKPKKIRFSDSCVFLASCAAGDKEEVKRLLDNGANVDTANVDGLTALHQACIDDNLDMVEFLIQNGADANRGDNEGWTPLHATASCGFLSIARYLLENGANVSSVNHDGELPLDISESESMENLLQQEIAKRGIDCEAARNWEEVAMLEDAKQWLNSGSFDDQPHPKTGASALHVAAAKGYLKVMSILLQGGADINLQDYDGWTPLHAGAHWGQRDACELLGENMCNMDIKNYVGQLAIDVADSEAVRVLEEMKKKQTSLKGEKKFGRRISSSDKIISKDVPTLDHIAASDGIIQQPSEDEVEEEESISSEESSSSTECSEDDEEEEKVNVNSNFKEEKVSSPPPKENIPARTAPPSFPPKMTLEIVEDSNVPSWRRTSSLRSKTANKTEVVSPSPAVSPPPVDNNKIETEVMLRRQHSDEKFYARKEDDLYRRIKASSLNLELSSRGDAYRKEEKPTLEVESSKSTVTLQTIRSPTSPPTAPVSPPSTPVSPASTPLTTPVSPASTPASPATTPASPASTPASPPPTPFTPPIASPESSPSSSTTLSSSVSTPTSPGGTKLSAGNIFKNFFKSFIPPVRDEESETQRKAHAKRVRETRRSTQGVTLEELKSAEQFVKKQQSEQVPATVTTISTIATAPSEPVSVVSAVATISVTSSTTKEDESGMERRPSWRLRLDEANKTKFSLEDARNNDVSTQQRIVVESLESPTVTIALRRRQSQDDTSLDSPSHLANSMATGAAIQRRRRPKRRSTGVVQIDMDEIELERQGESKEPLRDKEVSRDTVNPTTVTNSTATSDNNEKVESSVPLNKETVPTREVRGRDRPESEPALPLYSSRLTGDLASRKAIRSFNGELDYKKLYEDCVSENDKLRERLRKMEEDLGKARQQLDQVLAPGSRQSLSESDKRERRALERKLSEMEEELKQMEQLKVENQKLKDENGALIRVISKLSK